MRGSWEKRRSVYDKAKDETITLGVTGGQRMMDKRSFDYVLRSGLAGGLAGCAVSNIVISTSTLGQLTRY